MSIFTLTDAQIKVGFIGSEGSSSLSPFTDIRLVFLSNEDIRKKASALDGIDVLWIQRSDTGTFTAAETDPKFIKNLRSYVENGGHLLLNQESFRYVTPLGLETRNPERRNKACIDEGYGRKLGFHAFKDHPLFAGLNGGAYIQRPVNDTTVRITGFFGNDMPTNGRVIAVDWDYIFLREDAKMVVEYDLGKGKVIAVGGYMGFSMHNLNAGHLAQFTANAIRYLAGKPSETAENYWYFGPNSVSECAPRVQDLDRLFAAIPSGVEWTLPAEKVQFANRTATANFWDVAGERLVVMGKEKGGIEEIWTHPFMALRDYEAGIKGSDSIAWLSDLPSEITISPSYICRTYKLLSGILTEVIVASPADPNAVVHYEYRGDVPVQITIQFRSNLRFMWPYSERVTGTICHGWDADYNAFVFQDRTGDLAVMAGGNKVPASHKSGQEGKDLMVNIDVTYNLDREDQLDFVITGTSEGMNTAVNAFDKGIREPQEILRSAVDHTSEIFNNSLIITTPNDTFNEGYLWALSGTDKFFVHTPGMGSSLVAGYSTTSTGWDGGHKVNGRPGYGWYFGRDGQWSGIGFA